MVEPAPSIEGPFDVRSVIAVLGAIVIIFFLTGLLEGPAIGVLAARRPATMEELVAARAEPAVVLARLGIAGVVSLLAGYLTGKIAGRREVTHALVAAAIQSFILVRDFAAQSGGAVPITTQLVFVFVTVGAMILGATVRARAARFAPGPGGEA